jgi:hypothetical protein
MSLFSKSAFTRRLTGLLSKRCRTQAVRSESTAGGAETPPSGYKARRYPWMTPGMLTLGFMPFFTFALGTWQVDRLKWKVNLIDELEEKLRREPMVLPPRIKCETVRFRWCVLTLATKA